MELRILSKNEKIFWKCNILSVGLRGTVVILPVKDLKCYNYGNERRDYEEGKV